MTDTSIMIWSWICRIRINTIQNLIWSQDGNINLQSENPPLKLNSKPQQTYFYKKPKAEGQKPLSMLDMGFKI